MRATNKKKIQEPNVISFEQKYIRYVFFISLHKMPSKTLTKGEASNNVCLFFWSGEEVNEGYLDPN